MNINTYGKDERLKFCREYIYRRTSNFDLPFNITLLPIPTTKDGITLHGTNDTLNDICEKSSAGDAVVGYAIPRNMREELSSRGALAVDVSLDEEFLKDNAKLTAEGTLGRILTEHPSALRDMKIGVIGYGRIGECLLNLLLFFGAEAVVFTSKEETRLDLCESGVSAVNSSVFGIPDELTALSKIDILLNTAPSKLIHDEAVPFLGETRIIELASGDNMPPDLYYERFSSVPALMYPRSAGFALGAAALRMLGFDRNIERR